MPIWLSAWLKQAAFRFARAFFPALLKWINEERDSRQADVDHGAAEQRKSDEAVDDASEKEAAEIRHDLDALDRADLDIRASRFRRP
jgi:transposase-like protein